MQAGTRVALVHDFLVDVRGAERVFLAVCDLFGEADLFTAVYDEEGTEGRFAHRTVHTSYLQRLRPNARTFRALLPLYPAAMESLDLRGYDLVISSSSAWAHGVIPDEDAVHVCYCHNPFRYAWNARLETLASFASSLKNWLNYSRTSSWLVLRLLAPRSELRRAPSPSYSPRSPIQLVAALLRIWRIRVAISPGSRISSHQ